MKSEYLTFAELAGERFPVADLRHDSMQYSIQFERARATPGYAVCTCSDKPLRLQIRRVFLAGSTQIVIGYNLAVWPSEREQHNCFFHDLSKPVNAIDKLKAPLIEEEDGSFALRADFTLEQRVVAKRKASKKPKAEPGAGKEKSSGLALISVLWFLFEKAGLNGWKPGWSRDWNTVRAHALRVARQNKLNGHPIAERLYIPRRFFPAQKDLIDDEYRNHFAPFVEQAKLFDAARAGNGDSSAATMKLALVVGQLNEIRSAQFGLELRIRHMRNGIYAKQAEADSLKERFPLCFGSEDAIKNNVGIFLVRVSAKGALNFVAGAVSLASSAFVLVDSGYEAQLADALVDAQRHFKKPLDVKSQTEIDAAADLRADFVLYDSGPQPVFMEVWGLLDEAYETRKREKIDIYERGGYSLWQWEAAHGEVLPSLPEPTSRRATSLA